MNWFLFFFAVVVVNAIVSIFFVYYGSLYIVRETLRHLKDLTDNAKWLKSSGKVWKDPELMKNEFRIILRQEIKNIDRQL